MRLNKYGNHLLENGKTTTHGLEISKLITKYILCDTSPEEYEQMQAWISESEDNKRFFDRLMSENDFLSQIKERGAIDTEKAWNAVEPRLQRNVSRFSIKLILRYAAIFTAVIIGGGSAYYFYISGHKKDSHQQQQTVEIKPGTNKAILFTADGNTIDLEKDTVISFSGLKMQNSQNTLSYQPNQNTSEKNGTPIESLNRLVTPKGGEYEVILPDGTHVWLNTDSELKYPNAFSGKERVVYLSGEAYFDVSKKTSHPFIVKTKDMHIHVLGTAFNIMAYGDNEVIHTTLVNGKLDVDFVKENVIIDHIQLQPNMQAAYQKGNTKGSSAHVDVNKYIAWKNDHFLFENERLEDILKTVSRWYDVNFTFENGTIKEVRYSCDMKRFDSFESMLNVLRQDADIELIVKNKTIHVKYKNK